MAEGFEPYHVPQQSRRDKLRVGAAAASAGSGNLQGCAGLLPLYDPSLLPSDLLSCAHPSSSSHHHHHHHHHNHNNNFSHHHDTDNDDCVVKEERANLMNYVGIGLMMNNASSSSSASASQQHQHIPYTLDPQSMNPNSINDINNHFLYNLRDFNHHHHQQQQQQQQSFVYKPEPLSLTQGGHNGNIGHVHGQGLSLSLSSHQNNNNNNNNNNLLPLELNLQRYDSPNFGSSSYVNVPNNNNNNNIAAVVVGGVVGGGSGAGTSTASHDVWRSSVPLGPFTGYASILKKSRFLKPAHQLLEEFCDVGPRGIYLDKIAAAAADDGSLMDPCSIENLGCRGGGDDNNSLSFGGDLGTTSSGGCGEHRGKKSRLISMLEEVFRRYKQYYQQMQAVVSSFETVAGLTNAAPYANLALKAMSKHFRCLKNAITEQLQFTNKVHSHMGGKDEVPKLGTSDRVGFYGQRPVQNSGYHEHQPVWRPQRGLPERAVTVLRAWLFEHFLHPYPTDTDKLMLAKQTGLSRNQVSNWFINARVRLWKPMVEEIHMLETRQAPKTSPREDHQRNANPLNDTIHSANSLASENPSTSTQRFQDAPISKRTRNELPHHISLPSEEPMNLSYHNFPSHHSNLGVGVSTAAGSSGVSLTLGLHQNNGIGLPEPYPINAAQRFGLDANNDGYVMGGFDAQSRHFGRDVIGSQLLHDFVG